MRAKPGQSLNHTAVAAPDARAAAHYYPAIYWYTMMQIPPESEFGGKGDIPEGVTRARWRQRMGNVDCVGCHQLGQASTRTIPAQLGHFEFRRGGMAAPGRFRPSGTQMTNRLAGELGGVPFKYFGDWTDRVAKGELPKHRPQRPQGDRAQHRRHRLGVVAARQVPSRPDLVGSAQSDRQRQRSAVWLAGIFHRHDADPRSEDARGDHLQDAGARPRYAGLAWTGTCRCD